MYRYVKVNDEGFVTFVAWRDTPMPEEEIKEGNFIEVDPSIDISNKKYENGEWVNIGPEPEPEMSETDKLMMALTDMYEQESANELAIMSALTDLYEAVLSE